MATILTDNKTPRNSGCHIAPQSTRNLLQKFEMKQKMCLYKNTFNPKAKGWVGPVKQQDSSTKWTKTKGVVLFLGIGRRQRQERIDVASLVTATRRRHKLHVASLGERQMDDDNDFEELLKSRPTVHKPFVNPMEKLQQGVWKSPNPLRRTSDIVDQFSFHRPKAPDRESLSTAFLSQQAQYMKKVLAQKEKEMKLLQSHLNKFNAETYRLLKELEGYRGKNYDEIFEENEALKEEVARVSKQNTLLHGRLQQRSNSVLQKIACKEKQHNSEVVKKRPKTASSIKHR